MTALLRMVIAALVAAFISGSALGTADSVDSLASMTIYTYDGLHHSVGLTYSTPERGPPGTDRHDTAYDAHGLRLLGASARPCGPAVIWTSSTYDPPARYVQRDSGSGNTETTPCGRFAESRADPGVGCATNTPSLKVLASEVREAGLHPAASNNRTIAVGVDADGRLFAGSSNGFDAGQRAALDRLGITRVPGSAALHAEEELLRGVPTLQRVGTSVRTPCGPSEHNCALQLIQRGVGVE